MEGGILEEVLARCGVFRRDFGPVGVQLFSHQLRQACERAPGPSRSGQCG